MNVLILHHFSDYWSNGLSKYGTTFEKEMEKVIDYINNENIDKVILPLFQNHQLEDCHYPLKEFCQRNGIQLDVHEYNYGWSKESDHNNDIYTEENFNETWCYGTREYHGEDDVVKIDSWQHELKGENQVIVAGAFEGECVLDLTTALDAIEVEYKREDCLIVGSYVEYEFKGQTIEELKNEILEKLQQIDNKVESKINNIESEYDENIRDLEELHIFAPAFMESIEDEINDLFDNYQEILEEKDLWCPLGVGYTADLSSEVFVEHEHSCEYQSVPDEHVEKIIEIKIRKIEHSYEDLTNIDSIEEFIMECERTAEQYFEELDELFKELKEEFDISDIENTTIESITKNTITDDYWNEYLLKDKQINVSILVFLQQKSLEEKLEGTYYHGTNWKFIKNHQREIEGEAFISLDQDYSLLGAVYVTQEEKTADWFVNYNNNNNNNNSNDKVDLQIPVVFKYDNVDINKIFHIRDDIVKRNGELYEREFKYEGITYDLQAHRELYFRELERKYNGVMIKNNYEEGGHDIAIFNEDLINDNLSGIKIFINDKWTDYLEPEEAIEIYKQEVKNILNSTKKRKIKR